MYIQDDEGWPFPSNHLIYIQTDWGHNGAVALFGQKLLHEIEGNRVIIHKRDQSGRLPHTALPPGECRNVSEHNSVGEPVQCIRERRRHYMRDLESERRVKITREKVTDSIPRQQTNR